MFNIRNLPNLPSKNIHIFIYLGEFFRKRVGYSGPSVGKRGFCLECMVDLQLFVLTQDIPAKKYLTPEKMRGRETEKVGIKATMVNHFF